jgi:uncharacterized protein YukE
MAARFESLNRLWNTVRESSHDFRASIDIFPILDTERVSRSLELAERGAASGSINRPVKSSRALDDVEQQIVAKVEEEKKASYQILEDQYDSFSDRLRSLDFEGQFGLIRQANYTSLADFKAEVTVGEDELHGLRRDLKVAEDELEGFKEKHGLRRAAKITTPAQMSFKIALLFLLLLIETILNGNFLAKGSEQGVLGGITEATTFAILNIGWALILAICCVRFLFHRSWFLKLLGLAGLALYVALAGAINLALAHYRELSINAYSDIGREVIQRLQTDPFGLVDLSSWTLFGLGIICSLLAFIDGWFMTDPYPGFAGTQKRVKAARDEYVDRKHELIENLKEIRDDHNEKVEAIIRDLTQRRAEHQAIITHRGRIESLFQEHQNQLERSANSLLTVYREANRQARTAPEPRYFKSEYKLERITPSQSETEEWSDSSLSDRIRSAQEELSEQMRKIGLEFEEAVKRYHQLDNLFPEA